LKRVIAGEISIAEIATIDEEHRRPRPRRVIE